MFYLFCDMVAIKLLDIPFKSMHPSSSLYSWLDKVNPREKNKVSLTRQQLGTILSKLSIHMVPKAT
jgi:hypothetical protein